MLMLMDLFDPDFVFLYQNNGTGRRKHKTFVSQEADHLLLLLSNLTLTSVRCKSAYATSHEQHAPDRQQRVGEQKVGSDLFCDFPLTHDLQT
jgi:hypothetical protein